ncbi:MULTISPECIES: DUF1906 domain-containing protein [unclassified Corynebacterium]|uniref:DUF1906 domain-containing protein n=1 Tax=unclassified Corynebacterium TaxID=2624378 RepID=UPI00264BABDD|nr:MULTISPECIES: DUF1906 domain-containing protein [unclassified Corynebacterium]MDN8595286.1 DUF1906 domain-containing protein [Corynebacterium sp. P4_F2]WKK56539.1 DUF1906 domain-containing protein [Corynebacterium sp. P4-C1]WKK63975.1 DUF1906 domain-containing protein [Corynebacterium sp. P8-C1]
MTASKFSRRRFLGSVSAFAAIGTAGIIGVSRIPSADAQNRTPVGTVLDYAAGVPSGRSIRVAGHMGAVRYVSQPRPDSVSWMKAKPVRLSETQDLAANGLFTASVYQFGRATTADWLTGAAGAAVHAPQAIQLHRAAGGPNGVPIYVAIDDNPSREQYTNQIRPYLRAFQVALTAAGLKTGVYGNYNTIQWCVEDGIGTYFWQHDWGSQGKLHPRANIHQKAGWQKHIDGHLCDINNVYTADWGQWKPGRSSTPAPAAQPQPNSQSQAQPQPAPDYRIPENSSVPDFSSNPTPQGMSSEAQNFARNIDAQDIKNAAEFARQFIK